jgi:uncharacterized protein involved in exopolysaccharide biosynthesis
MKQTEPIAKLDLYDLLLLAANWRKLFIVNFLIVVVLAVIIALILPKWYQATTIILPPSGSTTGVPSFLSKDLTNIATSFGLEVPSEDIYQTVLSSRTLKERIIDRFNLREIYKMQDRYPEDVIKAFEDHMQVITRQDRAIEITVEDRDPERAAAMTNSCVAELDRIFRDITSETARKNRTYIGKRLAQVQDSIAVLSDSLKRFQEATGAISISDQVSALITSAADLKAEQLLNDVKLDVLRSTFGSDHPMVNQMSRTSAELNGKYNQLLEGAEGRLFLALNELPELGRRYAELMRQTVIQQRLLEYIYPQYESALIQEQRETSNVQILDQAQTPQRKSRPTRKLIVLFAGVASLIITLVLVLLVEYWRALPVKDLEDWNKIQKLISTFRRS